MSLSSIFSKESFTLMHRALRGAIDADSINRWPKALRDLFGSWQRKRVRQGNRSIRRLMKARAYLAAALAGGGSREVARRARQLAKIAAK
jgi:hypothetical protein